MKNTNFHTSQYASVHTRNTWIPSVFEISSHLQIRSTIVRIFAHPPPPPPEICLSRAPLLLTYRAVVSSMCAREYPPGTAKSYGGVALHVARSCVRRDGGGETSGAHSLHFASLARNCKKARWASRKRVSLFLPGNVYAVEEALILKAVYLHRPWKLCCDY